MTEPYNCPRCGEWIDPRATGGGYHECLTRDDLLEKVEELEGEQDELESERDEALEKMRAARKMAFDLKDELDLVWGFMTDDQKRRYKHAHPLHLKDYNDTLIDWRDDTETWGDGEDEAGDDSHD